MTPQPIFIVGSGRSGTSALTWAIGQHPNIIVTPETNWLTALASYLEAFYDIGKATPASHFTRFNVGLPGFLEGMGKGVDQFVRDSFEARFPERRNVLQKPKDGMAWSRSKDDPKQRWVDGTPSNTPYVSVLAEMFPEAKFINLIRHPDNVLVSWLGISWRDPAHSTAESLLEHIYHSQKIGYLAEAALGADRIARVFFNDMTKSPEGTMGWLSKFIGEEYSPHMIEPLEKKINSTGETKPEVEAEHRSVIQHELLNQMRYWYDQASDDTWQICLPDEAAEELAEYARHRIPLPA